MRTYHSINVTNKCNKACSYCINKPYINKKEYPDIMKFEDLRNWLENEIAENDIVEIAGTGEPTLCEWLPDLLSYLNERKAWVLLRTNGFKLDEWRLNLSNTLVVLSKHDSEDYYITDKCKYLLPNDLILLGNSEEQMQGENDKASKTNNILFTNKTHDIERAFFVTPDGKVRYMPCMDFDMGNVWDYKYEKLICIGFSQCPFALGAFNFIEYLRNPFELPSECGHVSMEKWCKLHKETALALSIAP